MGWVYTSVIAYIGGKALLGRTFSHHKNFVVTLLKNLSDDFSWCWKKSGNEGLLFFCNTLLDSGIMFL